MPPLTLGFWCGVQPRHYPMQQAIRASSPHELAHAVSYREACFPAHGRTAATFFTPYARPAFSPDTVGRIDGAMSWGESLTKEAR
ncbi:hypothetical protein K7G95_14050 [Escherichia coli]|nr:hypothetical protein K7G95_14050 [Escherichia coli]